MRNTMIRHALLNSTVMSNLRAFETKNGWKMDADGKLELDAEGNPIYINAAGQEQSVKGDTISNLNNEAKTHRTAKEKAEGELKKYEVGGKLIDPALAVKAVETVSKLDAKQLIDAGEVDRVKDTIKAEFTAQLEEATKTINTLKSENNTLKIDKVFDGSELVREGIAVPPDMFRSYFAKNFKVEEDGTVAAYGPDGNRLLSKKSQGQYADPEEALSLLVEAHSSKDTILKANTGGGSGNGGGGGNRAPGKTIRRADFEALPAHEQAAIATKGEQTIVD